MIEGELIFSSKENILGSTKWIGIRVLVMAQRQPLAARAEHPHIILESPAYTLESSSKCHYQSTSHDIAIVPCRHQTARMHEIGSAFNWEVTGPSMLLLLALILCFRGTTVQNCHRWLSVIPPLEVSYFILEDLICWKQHGNEISNVFLLYE